MLCKNVPYSLYQIYVTWPENAFPADTFFVFKCYDYFSCLPWWFLLLYVTHFLSYLILLYIFFPHFLPDSVSLAVQFFHIP
jgi:hypothetical protein